MGRQRIHSSASERVKASIDALTAAGGARKTFRISPTGVEALNRIRELTDDPTETATIERLLVQERRRLDRAVGKRRTE